MWTLTANVDIDCQWVPREENIRADASTHITAIHDFKLCDDAYKRVEERYGEHSIDRFACPDNVKVRSGAYNSRFLEPGMMDCKGIDALAQPDWHLHNNYVHPPYALLAPTIHTIRRTKAKATLIFPAWKGAVFWPLLRSEDGRRWASDVVSVMYLGMAVDPKDARLDVLIPLGDGTREQLPRGHIYAARIEPIGESHVAEKIERPMWQGKWWSPDRKRKGQGLRETKQTYANKRYRRQAK